MPILGPDDMISGEPLPGWNGRFFHAENMTFAHYEIAAGAPALHEHHHLQEEVWNVVEGEIALSIGGHEHSLRAGDVAIIPPDTPHSARVIGACRVVVTDHPRRDELPGGIGRKEH
jgi:mannose-6-phosphate isomerase-like protein (cupin superfamily)